MSGLPDTTKKAHEDDPQDEPRGRSFYTPSLARVALVGASAGVAELYFFGLSPVLALAAAAAGVGFFVVFALFAGYIESETTVSAIAGARRGRSGGLSSIPRVCRHFWQWPWEQCSG